ncbi:MAG: zinc ribbon domain-containing protein [Candidatus Nanopelagicales bacterium]
MKASRDQQLLLLELQKLETLIDQLNHKAKNLPEVKEQGELRVSLPIAENELVARSTAVADLQVLVKRADADVEQVRLRIERDSALIDGGSLSAKDLVNMQHELETLKRRQATLEDEELEIMSQVEAAEKLVAEQGEIVNTLKDTLAKVTAVADSLLNEINLEKVELQQQAVQLKSQLDVELLKLYDKIRSDHGGIGAAELSGKTCGGCRIEISATDLATIQSSAEDEVVRCDECRRILIR